jgi:hypothetical protein
LSVIEKAAEEIMPSRVRYIDYEKGIWHHATEYPRAAYNMLVPLVHKRKEFVHENEFRLLIETANEKTVDEYWAKRGDAKGELVKIDVRQLVEKVILSPSSDSATDEKIINLTLRLGFEFEFEKSKLNDEPYY